MARALQSIPLFVALIGVGALAMLVPAAHAWALSDYRTGRAFLYSALLFLFLTWLLGLASAGNPPGPEARSRLTTMLAAFTLLPLILAIPFYEALPDTGLFNAWWEMVSSLTATGATLYAPERLAASLHLWRAMVGWMGGYFMLVMAVAVLAPLRLGGYEIFGARDSGAFARAGDGEAEGEVYAPAALDGWEPGERIRHYALAILPAYVGLTAVLWLGLMILGDAPFIAACVAMGTLSTSGVTPFQGPSMAPIGLSGEMLVFLFMAPALTRRLWPGGGELRPSARLIDDPELRLAAALVLGVAGALFLRHWLAALEISSPDAVLPALRSLWGSLFTALSFLTTTGFESAGWNDSRAWSGLGTPGLILAGLAMMGGGVATAAGGVRLLRVYALVRQSQREMDRLIHPNSVAGGGATGRWLRREGAYVAWIFFILFAFTLAAVIAALSLTRLDFASSTIMAIAALTNTGQLAQVAGDHPLSYAELGGAAKTILVAAMVLGKLETLAIIALLNPEFWRG